MRLASRQTPLLLVAILGLTGAAAPLAAQSWRVAPRYLLNWGGPKTYAGDINGYGVALSREMPWGSGARWELRATYDHLEYDVEVPIRAVGIEPADPEPVDPFGTVHRGEVDVARFFRTGAMVQPFVHAGAGVYFIDVTEIDGIAEGGDPYHLVTEPTTPTAGITIGIGADVQASQRFGIAFGFSYSQTIGEYELTDTESGATGTIRPFAPLGLNVAVSYRFD